MKTRVIALANQKGGSGKTTTAVNLGAALARSGKRTLITDLDPQGHATLYLGIIPEKGTSSVYEVLKGTARVEEAAVKVFENLELLPATVELSGAEEELRGYQGKERLLRDALRAVAGRYDFILIDCPPSLGLLTLAALVAAGELIITVQAQFFALAGSGQLLETVELVRSRGLNPGLKLSGILATIYDQRTALASEVVAEMKKHFPGRVFKTQIRVNVALAEAPIRGRDIFRYQPASHGAQDYEALAREVMRKGE